MKTSVFNMYLSDVIMIFVNSNFEILIRYFRLLHNWNWLLFDWLWCLHLRFWSLKLLDTVRRFHLLNNSFWLFRYLLRHHHILNILRCLLFRLLLHILLYFGLWGSVLLMLYFFWSPLYSRFNFLWDFVIHYSEAVLHLVLQVLKVLSEIILIFLKSQIWNTYKNLLKHLFYFSKRPLLLYFRTLFNLFDNFKNCCQVIHILLVKSKSWTRK